MMQKNKRYAYLLSAINVSPDLGEKEICAEAERKMKRTGVSTQTLHFRLYKKSVDARKKQQIRLACTVLVESERELPARFCERAGLKPMPLEDPEISLGKELLSAPPVVVGMGPAGLFASLWLARNGYRPILIDRGGSIDERVAAVDRFVKQGILDPDCNIQFGAGGAGTFSDGKLVTRINDPLCRSVIETFHAFGAPEEILTLAKPHIGTDVLRGVVARMLEEIERLGGRVIYRCRMESFEERESGVLVCTEQGEIAAGALILAIGHSARDTYLDLIRRGYAIEPKPISVGFRIEHLQSDIDTALYGDFAGHPNLGHAEYALSDTTGERGVYTFCMCPGGEVVAAASEEGGVVVNGMSNHARDGRNANAAVLTSVTSKDYAPIDGSLALGAIAFQRQIERAAFRAGGEAYDAPMMTVGDFLGGAWGSEPTRILPSYRSGRVRAADFESVYPRFAVESLRGALRSFGKKIEGYDAPDAILTGAETRTSAPIRILRSAETLLALGKQRIYPCGEGAGYAGGITSAGVDGLRVAISLMARYAPIEEANA